MADSAKPFNLADYFLDDRIREGIKTDWLSSFTREIPTPMGRFRRGRIAALACCRM